MTKVYLAEMETEKYTWKCVGKTEAEAKQGILKLWESIKYTDKSLATVEKLDQYYGINMYMMILGEAIYE